MSQDNQGRYGSVWDEYVKSDFPRIRERGPTSHQNRQAWRVLNTTDNFFRWPGDEWGSQTDVDHILGTTLYSQLEQEPTAICEIGAGAGRYTRRIFDNYPLANVYSADVSSEFENSLRERCAAEVETGRLQTCLLDANHGTLLDFLTRQKVLGCVDALVSYDAMVHVDLHTLVVYWVSAAKALRVNGLVAMSVADCTSDGGFSKLLNNASTVYANGGSVGYHFQWISPDIVRGLLGRLGFEVALMDCNGRDLFFTARLVDPARHREWLQKSGNLL